MCTHTDSHTSRHGRSLCLCLSLDACLCPSSFAFAVAAVEVGVVEAAVGVRKQAFCVDFLPPSPITRIGVDARPCEVRMN